MRWTQEDADRAQQRMNSVNVVGTVGLSIPKKPPRYLNQKCEMDGHTFDSKSEWSRYMTLKAMQESGLIAGLRVHPDFPLNAPNGALVGRYIADFSFMQDGKLVVEDCKSPRTAELGLFRWKFRHMWLQHGIEVRLAVKRWKVNELKTA